MMIILQSDNNKNLFKELFQSEINQKHYKELILLKISQKLDLKNH